MLSRGGHDVECGGAVGKIWEKFFDGGDLRASFGGVGGLGGRPANFVRGALLRESRQGKHRSGEDETKKTERGDKCGGHVFVLRRREVGIILDAHAGVFSKEYASDWEEGRYILFFCKRAKE